MPIYRDRIGSELHRGIGGLDKRDVVAHQDAHAIAFGHAQPLQTAGNPGGPLGYIGMIAAALAADDAQKKR